VRKAAPACTRKLNRENYLVMSVGVLSELLARPGPAGTVLVRLHR